MVLLYVLGFITFSPFPLFSSYSQGSMQYLLEKAKVLTVYDSNHIFRFSLVSVVLFSNEASQVAAHSGPTIRDSIPIQRRIVVTVTSINDKTTTVYPTRIGTAQTIPESDNRPSLCKMFPRTLSIR